MKELSATKRFRQDDAPNRFVQDLPKIPLLCEDCEQRIKVYEDKFKAAVWDPWCERLEAGEGELPDDLALPSEAWMDLFVFSVAWRALHLSEDFGRRRYKLDTFARAADDDWRPALWSGDLPGPHSKLWVLQTQQIDALLQERNHTANRRYVVLSTHVMNADNPMAARNVVELSETKNVDGVPRRVSVGLGYEIGTTPTSMGYYLSFVKGFGFLFLGVHTRDHAVADSVHLDDVVQELLDHSIRAWDASIAKKLSPRQRAKDEAARKANEANPTLSMRIRQADDREREGRNKER